MKRTLAILALLGAVAACGDDTQRSSSNPASDTAAPPDDTAKDTIPEEEEGEEEGGGGDLLHQWDFERNDLPSLGSFDELAAAVGEAATATGISVTLLDPSSEEDGWIFKFDGSQAMFINGELMVIETLAPNDSTGVIDDLRAFGTEADPVTVAGADGECASFEDEGYVRFLQCRSDHTDILLVEPFSESGDRSLEVAERAIAHPVDVGDPDLPTDRPGLHIPDAFADSMTTWPLDASEPVGSLATRYDDPAAAIEDVASLAASAGVTLNAFDNQDLDHDGGIYLGAQSLVVVGADVTVVQTVGAMSETFLDNQVRSLPDDATATPTEVAGLSCVQVSSPARAALVCWTDSVTLTLI